MKHTIIALSVLLLFASNSLAQISINSSVDSDDLVCPGVRTQYSVSLSSGNILCSVQWRIAKGIGSFYLNESDVNPVEITWDDQKPNNVEVSADVNYTSSGSCPGSENATLTFTQSSARFSRKPYLMWVHR